MPLLGTTVAMVVAVTCRRAASFSTACCGGSCRAGIGGASLAALEAMRYRSASGIGCCSGCGDGRVSSRRGGGIALSAFVSRGWGLMIGTLEGSGRRLRRKSSLPLLYGVEGRDKKMRSGGGAFFSSSVMINGGISTPPPSVVKVERSPGKTVNANTWSMELPSNESSERLVQIRHSCAHVMAMAVQRLFPKIQVTIGPWIQDGFYYDFHCPSHNNKVLSESDLKEIKKEIDKIIKKKLPFIREEVTREEAQRRIESLGEPFKLEILESIKNEPITLYHIGDEWWDLCAGPHVENTGELSSKAIALQHVAGAYWRGDENREMLQRIYGTAWESPEQLKEHERRLNEAKKRDHRLLGKKLDLFSIQEDAGGGLVFWHPKGSRIRRLIEDYWTDIHIKEGYELLHTPHIANVGLWKTSGHFDFYNESMFSQMEVEKEEYQLKPMNCPFHCLVYKDTLRGYRELPIRYAEMGTVYRYEPSGTLHGLMRVRGFTQDDGHIFCLPDQLRDEIIGVLNMVEEVLTRFGFNDYKVMLSTRPEKCVGGDEIWSMATDALQGALQIKGWEYTVDEGGGAFYGPKIDVKIRDAIGRYWQCSTIQCDFNLPQCFDLEYVNKEGARSQPVMLHRAIFGSLERFFAVLLEDSAGDLPYWLAAVQVRILPVTDEFRDSAEKVAQRMQQVGIRAQVDSKSDRLKKQIRNAEKARIPVMCILGETESTTGTLSVRRRGATDLGSANVEHLIEVLKAANQGATEPDLMQAIIGAQF